MKRLALLSLALLALPFLLLDREVLISQDAATANPDVPAEDAEQKAAGERLQLAREEKFKKLLSGATLEGTWRLVKDGRMSEARQDRYTLGEIKKAKGKRWIINARIQYGDKDVNFPVPVDVEWAGDTPVISITDFNFPLLGKYTARVLFYENLYAGNWFGVGYGGLMSGVIRPKKDGSAKKGGSPEKGESARKDAGGDSSEAR